MKTFARQWYGHAAGILLLWTRLAGPGAVIAAWLGRSPWPLVVGPAAAACYALGYITMRSLWQVRLRHLKRIDALLLGGAVLAPCLALAPLVGAPWLMVLPGLSLFGLAWYLNWRHAAPAILPGSGDLPAAPTFVAPVTGPVTATYRGYDVSHTGVDIGVAAGTPVWAPAPGRVVHAGPLEQWGWTVCIDYGNGWSTLFAHLDRVAVRRGQEVAAGELIAWSGTSGISTGPHVHVELRCRGVPVDPAFYFPFE